jgi:hypothetical protein
MYVCMYVCMYAHTHTHTHTHTQVASTSTPPSTSKPTQNLVSKISESYQDNTDSVSGSFEKTTDSDSEVFHNNNAQADLSSAKSSTGPLMVHTKSPSESEHAHDTDHRTYFEASYEDHTDSDSLHGYNIYDSPSLDHNHADSEFGQQSPLHVLQDASYSSSGWSLSSVSLHGYHTYEHPALEFDHESEFHLLQDASSSGADNTTATETTTPAPSSDG